MAASKQRGNMWCACDWRLDQNLQVHENGMVWKHFPYVLALCEGNAHVTRGFPHKVPKNTDR